MKNSNLTDSFGAKLKKTYTNFQFVVNTAIDDDDVKQFILYGFKHILKKEKYVLFVMTGGLFVLLFLTGFLSFIGLCIFIAALSYIGVQMIKFVSGDDEEIFEDVKVELDQQEAIPQKNLTSYVTARINQKKFSRRRSG